ncbi:uncharacterized protein LOC124172726 [Ischnura elegans]|uniref:uncharacterized protein LOC124172726 n=1 Tax=Ischnura elegans TaxID=197161 RepID=UPI001ED8691C|nr:uncharacterized protein LOC124172726 [Ischnura elegans]XP_046408155.1 uncharacterized protein LOC124172726 [Ischnura elegans]
MSLATAIFSNLSERSTTVPLCRLCMQKNLSNLNIFTSNVACQMTVEDALHDLIGLRVAVGDGLPATICPQCLKKLMEFCDFKKICYESESDLRTLSSRNYSRSIQGEGSVESRDETNDCIRDATEGSSQLECSLQKTEIYIPVPDCQSPRANMLFSMKEEIEDHFEEGHNPVLRTTDPSGTSSDARDPLANDDLARKTGRKRKATDDLREFLDSHQVKVRPVALETTDSQEKEKFEAESTKRTSKGESDMVMLKLEDLRGVLEETNKKKQAEIQREVKKAVAEMFKEHMPKLVEEALSKKSSNTTSSGHRCDRGTGNNPAMDIEEKVHLGGGIFCSESAYNSMQTAEEDRNWAISLLVGVFGEEDAKKMRVYPRKKGLIPFSLTFLTVAKAMYRERMIKMGKFAANDVALEQKVKKLPSYLADRSLDLNGPRGIAMSSAIRQQDQGFGNESKQSSGDPNGASDFDVVNEEAFENVMEIPENPMIEPYVQFVSI